jgi:CHAT domain-containing protein
MSKSRCLFCLVLLACVFAATPAQPEDWARDLTSVQSRQQALSQLIAERTRLQAAGDQLALVKTINRIVELHLMLYDLDAALVAASEARELAKQFHGSEAETVLVDTLTLCGRVHVSRDENRLALPLLEDALEISRKLQYRAGEAESHAQIGSAYSGLSKFEEAEKSSNLALTIWRDLQNQQGEAHTLLSLYETHTLADKVEEATTDLKRAETIWRELNDSVSLAETLIYLSFLSMRQGQWQSALVTLDEAQTLLANKEEPFLAGKVAMSFGVIYEAYGQLETALGYYEESLVKYRDVAHDKRGTIDAGIKVGRVRASLGDYAGAIQQIEQLLSVAKEIDKDLYVGLCHEDLGQVWLAAGSYEQARREFQSAIDYFARAGTRRPWARAQSYLGETEFLLGNVGSASNAYQSALGVFQKLPDYTNEAALTFSLGKLALHKGQYDIAEKYLDRSIELTERLRENAASRDLRGSFLASVHDRYEAYVELLMARHDKQPHQRLDIKAFEASESGRARSLMDALRGYQRELRHPSDPLLLLAEEKLQREEQELVDEKAKLLSRGASAKEIAKVDRELRDLGATYETLQARINSSKKFTNLLRPGLDYESIKQEVTNADTSLLEYSLGTKNSFAWLVTKDGLKSYKLADKQTIANAANKLIHLLSAPTIGTEQQAQLQTAVDEVSRLVLDPLSHDLRTSRLIVVADGILQYVPFQVLKASASATEPLLAQFDIIAAPSASTLAIVRQERTNRQPAPKLLVGFGDAVFSSDYSPKPKQANGTDLEASRSNEGPKGREFPRLFNAKRELRAIGDLVGDEASFFVEYDATRANLLKVDFSQFRILHVVTHGRLDDDQPEQSGLFLSLVDENDRQLNGFVGLADIYKMHAPVDLVVLSACHTALGENVRGEGLIGLTRGFMYAGASSVVASLWKVDDAATAELMKHFYGHLLRDGMTPPAALRAAQNKIRAQPKWKSPYYWAGFTFQGNYDLNLRVTSPEVRRTYGTLLGGGALIILLAAATYWYLRRRRV